MLTLALMLAIADEPKVLNIRVEGNGESSPCVATINGNSVDPRDETALAEAFARYPAKDWLIELSGSETVTYRCVGGLIYRMQTAGYQFTRMGYVQSPGKRGRRRRDD